MPSQLKEGSVERLRELVAGSFGPAATTGTSPSQAAEMLARAQGVNAGDMTKATQAQLQSAAAIDLNSTIAPEYLANRGVRVSLSNAAKELKERIGGGDEKYFMEQIELIKRESKDTINEATAAAILEKSVDVYDNPLLRNLNPGNWGWGSNEAESGHAYLGNNRYINRSKMREFIEEIRGGSVDDTANNLTRLQDVSARLAAAKQAQSAAEAEYSFAAQQVAKGDTTYAAYLPKLKVAAEQAAASVRMQATEAAAYTANIPRRPGAVEKVGDNPDD